LDRFCPEDRELVLDYLWAWLNVNTRCIHYRIDPSLSSPKNMTLCPVLDFANHTPRHSDIVPVLRSSEHSYALGGDYVFKASPEHKLLGGSEIFLCYGGHANRTLFTEYGFVNKWEEGTVENGPFDGEVDVQDLVEGILRQADPATAGQTKQVLEEEGYWGDWTIHSSPAPAHPSYRLITALRLFHWLDKGKGVSEESNAESVPEEWRKVIRGEMERISGENERSWRGSALKICEQVAVRARAWLQDVRKLNEGLDETPDWFCWMQNNILLLWQEELEVANSVIHSIQTGEDF